MKTNPFKSIQKSVDKKTIHITETERKQANKKRIVTNVKDYVKIRIEMGIFRPMELTDVYSLDIYIGIQIPKDLDVLLNGEEICLKEKDYLVFDFNDNIFYIKQKDFSSFYRHSKIAPYQQLLSAIQLFKIETNPDEIFIKGSYNESIREEEDVIFGKLTEMIMNGNVEDEYIESYQKLMDEKYKNELINYLLLSDFKAKYLCRKLKEKKIPFALICPLVDSIVESEEGDFDVDNIIKVNNYIALILTIADGAIAVASCVAQMNKEFQQDQELRDKAHSLDTMSQEELIAFKSQLDAAGIVIPSISSDAIVEQIKQEAIEESQVYGDDVLSKDASDILR